MLHEARDLRRTRIGADVVCEALLRQGVDVFFSYPGGVILPLYDVLGDYELRHVLVRHEQGGAHAADGYARVTGRVGVCMGTSGRAPRTSSPASGPPSSIGADGRHHRQCPGGADRQGRLPGDRHQRHHVADDEHNYLVRDADELPRSSPRPSTSRGASGGRAHRHHQGRPAAGAPRGAPTEADIVAGLPGFRRTRRPTVASSSWPPKAGQRQAPDDPRRPRRAPRRGMGRAAGIRRKTNIPVAWTLLGIGAMPEDHPLAYGYMGMRLEARQPCDPDG